MTARTANVKTLSTRDFWCSLGPRYLSVVLGPEAAKAC